MLLEALAFLIRNLASFFILNLLLRFYLQVARAPFGHPLAQFTVKLTNFIVMPVRRIVPSVAGYDTATLLLAWLAALLMHAALLLLSTGLVLWTTTAGAAFLCLGVLELIKLTLYLLLGAVLVQAVMSWINPYNPLTPMLETLTRPFLAPIRKLLPQISGIDLSPFVLLLLLQMLLNFALMPLEWQLRTLIVIG